MCAPRTAIGGLRGRAYGQSKRGHGGTGLVARGGRVAESTNSTWPYFFTALPKLSSALSASLNEKSVNAATSAHQTAGSRRCRSASPSSRWLPMMPVPVM